MFRLAYLGALVPGFALAGCFNPETDPGLDLDTDTESTDGSSGISAGPTGDPTTATTTEPTTTDPTTIDPTTTDPTTSTSDGAVCGDGEVTGEEVCDDGVNDGSYGGCVEDCSAAAAGCGDGEVNGEEVCDDRINDGSYDACAPDCTFGPRCGDGMLNGPEGCDEGDENADGMGCNANCVASGSQIGLHNVSGLSYCEGAFLMDPVFNSNGNTYIAASGQCSDDSLLLIELDPDTNVVEEHHDDLVLPSRRVEGLAVRGDDWLLATDECNYVITQAGVLEAEVCEVEGSRITGDWSLEGVDDDLYIAHARDDIAMYGSSSPALGDSPLWVYNENPSTDYSLFRAAVGHSGTVLRLGRISYDGGSTYRGYVEVLSAAGNLVTSRNYSDVFSLADIAPTADGGFLLESTNPAPVLLKLNADLSEAFTISPSTTNFSFSFAADSNSNIVLGYRDTENDVFTVQKLTPNGQTELWSTTIDQWPGSFSAMAVAPDDSIWVMHQYQDITHQVDIVHLAP